MANAIEDNGGVYLIPAFSGLGSPHWQMKRRASLSGMSFGTKKNHIVRAALESIPYQIADVITAMEKDAGVTLKELMADGGISSNSFIMNFLASLLNKPVVNIGIPDVSALGAAYMAGLYAGVYMNIDYLKELNADKTIILPSGEKKIKAYYKGWKNAITNA